MLVQFDVTWEASANPIDYLDAQNTPLRRVQPTITCKAVFHQANATEAPSVTCGLGIA